MTTSPGTPAIAVADLHRRYGDFEAVRGVDLEVATGSVTALLGTNGAGKTSTLELIEGLAVPSAGSVRVLGLDPVAERPAVRTSHRGAAAAQRLLRRPHRPRDPADVGRDAHPPATRRRHARRAAARGPRGRPRRRALRRRASAGSTWACALMGHPEVVLLDEPTTGLDPETRRDVWDLVRGLTAEGTTVLMSTHYLEEAEALADRLEIMHAGRIARSGTPAEIAEGHPSTISFRTPPTGLPAIRCSRVVEEHGTTTLETDDLQGTLTTLLTAAARDGVRLDGLAARTASLESVFLDLADHSVPTDEGVPA